MKIFLTGQHGFIGGHMHQALLNAGHQVTCYDWVDTMPIDFIEKKYNWIVHIGANSSTVERDVEKIMVQNYDYSVMLYEIAAEMGANFQYASSASVYGLSSTFKEDAPLDPRNPYAWTKYLFERYVRKNPRNIIAQGFRYFNVYGPEGEDHKGKQASPYCQFRQQAETLGQIQLFEHSEQYRRDFIHVNDVINTHIKFFDVPESGVWNIGTGSTTSFREVAESFNVDIVEIPMPDVLKSNYQTYTCADITHTHNTLQKYGLL